MNIEQISQGWRNTAPLLVPVFSEQDCDRTSFLAEPLQTWRSLFDREFPKKSVQEYQVKLIIYDSVNEVIVQWQS